MRELAHDLKNSLGILLLLLDVSRRAGDATAAGLAAQLAQLIGRLRAQIEQAEAELGGRAAPEPERLATDRVVGYVGACFAATLPASVRLELAVTVGLPAVALSAVGLERVLGNLLANARESLPLAGGSLRVTAHLATAGRAVVLTVADTGAGLPPEVLALLGEPGLTTKAAGHGVGLGSVKRQVEQAGGSLALTSVVGAGTQVTVTLPVA